LILVYQGDRIGTYSINREEVVLAELAANLQSFTTVPLYDTLGKPPSRILLPYGLVSTPRARSLVIAPTHAYTITALRWSLPGEDAVEYVVGHAEIAVIICSRDKTDKVRPSPTVKLHNNVLCSIAVLCTTLRCRFWPWPLSCPSCDT
jgi:hypothetical protein